jgi:hypothetical protein
MSIKKKGAHGPINWGSSLHIGGADSSGSNSSTFTSSAIDIGTAQADRWVYGGFHFVGDSTSTTATSAEINGTTSGVTKVVEVQAVEEVGTRNITLAIYKKLVTSGTTCTFKVTWDDTADGIGVTAISVYHHTGIPYDIQTGDNDLGSPAVDTASTPTIALPIPFGIGIAWGVAADDNNFSSASITWSGTANPTEPSGNNTATSNSRIEGTDFDANGVLTISSNQEMCVLAGLSFD